MVNRVGHSIEMIFSWVPEDLRKNLIILFTHLIPGTQNPNPKAKEQKKSPDGLPSKNDQLTIDES